MQALAKCESATVASAERIGGFVVDRRLRARCAGGVGVKAGHASTPERPHNKTDRWRDRPFDLGKRAVELEQGIERLIIQAKIELASSGVDVAGLPDMQIVAMA